MKYRTRWKHWIAAALALSLLAAALALVPGTPRPPVGWLERAARPVFSLVRQAALKTREGADILTGTAALREENRALKAELSRLRPLARTGELAAGENERLRALLDLPRRGLDLDLTAAWRTARSFDNWQQGLTLDRGTDQGLAPGQCVIDQGGALVGRVAEAGRGWAAVTLVTDPAFRAAGQAAVSGVPGALEGDLSLLAEGKLALTCLTRSDRVAAGESVVTFGGGENYPSGLTVGRVDRVEDDPDGLTRRAVIAPAVTDCPDQVFVVTGFREAR